MFNKFELFGIGASIMSMAAALYLVNIETSVQTTTPIVDHNSQSAVVIVGDEANKQAALRNAILDAAADNGSLNKMIIDDVIIGSGKAAMVGDTITVHYVGTLQNGQEFDNSNKRGQPFTFTLGEGKVIKGWEDGILGMQTGGKRILVIPSDRGYGEKGYGPIPGGASLVFAVELLSIN